MMSDCSSDLPYSYNSDLEQPVCFIRIPMSNIEKIVIGPLGMLLRSSKRIHMRIYYTLIDGKTCYFTFKTMNFTSMDEDKGQWNASSLRINKTGSGLVLI